MSRLHFFFFKGGLLARAGDALHVCLNVIAVLFLCEVDNASYMVALNERVRARVEDAGRGELSDDDLIALTRTKLSHVVAIVLCVLIAVATQVSGVPLLAQSSPEWWMPFRSARKVCATSSRSRAKILEKESWGLLLHFSWESPRYFVRVLHSHLHSLADTTSIILMVVWCIQQKRVRPK